jgi:hypothetical protein
MKSKKQQGSKREAACTALAASGGWIIGRAVENEAGYWPLTYGPYDTEERAQMVANNINAQLGITPIRAMLIVASSMAPMGAKDHAARKRGWADAERDAIARKASVEQNP